MPCPSCGHLTGGSAHSANSARGVVRMRSDSTVRARAAPGPEPQFGEGDKVGVVVDRDGRAKPGLRRQSQRHGPFGQRRGPVHHARRMVDKARHPDADPRTDRAGRSRPCGSDALLQQPLPQRVENFAPERRQARTPSVRRFQAAAVWAWCPSPGIRGSVQPVVEIDPSRGNLLRVNFGLFSQPHKCPIVLSAFICIYCSNIYTALAVSAPYRGDV